jgi:sugar/nucleoside kinase (ribokinase family)
LFIAIGSIIIDDIVLPSGRTFMATLGGGMTHAAMGMRVWTDQVRPIATVGEDFPADQWAQMAGLFDMGGILHRNWMTTRAWQLFEENGHRTEVFRTPMDLFFAANPRADEMALDLLHAEGVYLQGGTADEVYSWIGRLRQAGSRFILWEPWERFTIPENWAAFQEIAKLTDAVSPNLEEARTLTGKNEPLDLVQCLAESAPLVALRMGAQGSLVTQKGGAVYQVSTVQVPEIVDVTGAGNAYCGGFIVGWATTGDLAESARYAAVSASMALGQYGAVYPMTGVRQKAIQRMEQVKITQVLL